MCVHTIDGATRSAADDDKSPKRFEIFTRTRHYSLYTRAPRSRTVSHESVAARKKQSDYSRTLLYSTWEYWTNNIYSSCSDFHGKKYMYNPKAT
jgi:hypothetical protein